VTGLSKTWLPAAIRASAPIGIAGDPHLGSPRGQALRTLLYLFRRDEAVQYLRAG
jgi:ATP-dependent DNA helicase RecG